MGGCGSFDSGDAKYCVCKTLYSSLCLFELVYTQYSACNKNVGDIFEIECTHLHGACKRKQAQNHAYEAQSVYVTRGDHDLVS